MSQKPSDKGSRGKEWKGAQGIPNIGYLTAIVFRVTSEVGRSCAGRLVLKDNAFTKNRVYSWSATFNLPNGWEVAGYENGRPSSEGFSPRTTENREIGGFVIDRLISMKNRGIILKDQAREDSPDTGL